MSGTANPISGSLYSPVGLILRTTCLDFLRRKDLYVVLLLMGIFGVGALAVRLIGVEDSAAGRFLSSAGLTLAHVLAGILAAVFSARALPEEFDQRTILPLLAKPVTRPRVILGKWGAALAIALPSYLLFVAVVVLAVPGGAGRSWAALLQVVALGMGSLLFVSMLAMLLSFFWPMALAALAALCWFLGAGALIKTGLGLAARGDGFILDAVARILAALPDPGLLAHAELYSGGAQPMAWGLFATLLAYGVAWTLALFGGAALLFEKRGF